MAARVETAGGHGGNGDDLPRSRPAAGMKATSSGIMAQQRPDAASNEPAKRVHDSQNVIQSLKRRAIVVGTRLSGKPRLMAIMGNITLAYQELDSESEVVRMLSEAESAAVQASGLTLQLLVFARGGLSYVGRLE